MICAWWPLLLFMSLSSFYATYNYASRKHICTCSLNHLCASQEVLLEFGNWRWQCFTAACRQTLLLSATLPKVLVEFARAGQTNFTSLSMLGRASLSHNLLSSLYSMQGWGSLYWWDWMLITNSVISWKFRSCQWEQMINQVSATVHSNTALMCLENMSWCM